MSNQGLGEAIKLQGEFRSAVIQAKVNVNLSADFGDAGSLAKTPEQKEVREAVYACQEMDNMLNMLVGVGDDMKKEFLGMIQKSGVSKWHDGFKTHENSSNPDIVNLIDKAKAVVNHLEKLEI